MKPEDSIDIFVVALENSTVSGIAFDLRDIPRFLFGMGLHYGTSIDRIQIIQNKTTVVCECSPFRTSFGCLAGMRKCIHFEQQRVHAMF